MEGWRRPDSIHELITLDAEAQAKARTLLAEDAQVEHGTLGVPAGTHARNQVVGQDGAVNARASHRARLFTQCHSRFSRCCHRHAVPVWFQDVSLFSRLSSRATPD